MIKNTESKARNYKILALPRLGNDPERKKMHASHSGITAQWPRMTWSNLPEPS